jgi:hypothetical protein
VKRKDPPAFSVRRSFSEVGPARATRLHHDAVELFKPQPRQLTLKRLDLLLGGDVGFIIHLSLVGVAFRLPVLAHRDQRPTLFSPLPSTNKTVYLIDMQGNVVHTWQMPYPPGQSGYLTDRGTLFYNGQIPNESHVGRAPHKGGAALEMTWSGRLLWEVKHPDHNHDGIRLRNGNVMLICQKPLPGDVAAKVQGGRPGSEYDGGKMDAPYLVELTTDGKLVWNGEAGSTSIPSQTRSRRPGRSRCMDSRQRRFRDARRKPSPQLPRYLDGRDDQPSHRRDLLEARRTAVELLVPVRQAKLTRSCR